MEYNENAYKRSLVNDLTKAIELQQARSDQDFVERMKKPLQERVNKGHTLANVEINIVFHEGRPNEFCPNLSGRQAFIDRVIIRCGDNVSRFREGATVILSHGSHCFKMTIEEDRIDSMVLVSGDYDVKENYIDADSYPRTGWEINEAHSNLTARLLSAARDRISREVKLNDRMERLLNGTLSNSVESINFASSDNVSQDMAVRKALGASDFHLIQGPPGTGKTYTIALIVKRLLAEGKRIFVTAPTHTAINNCLNAISRIAPDGCPIVKVGEKSQAVEILSNPNVIRKTRFPFMTYQGNNENPGIVIGATPYALCYPASKKLAGWNFDCIIIDEAAQMSIPLALAAITAGRKTIFVGDHRQLDPIVPGGTGNWLFAKSIFKHLVDKYPSHVTMLTQSYRLSESLVHIPSRLFYEGRLQSARARDDKEFTRFDCAGCQSQTIPDILRNDSNEVLFLHHQFDALGRSPFEAQLCAELVKVLRSNGIRLDDIAVITPYRAQVREVKKALVRNGIIDEDLLDEVFVDTIERMQGQERDYVIFTLANSNPAEVEDRLDFFYSPNRLNVAITRARTKCIVLANEKVFQLCEETKRTGGAAGDGQAAYWNYYMLATKVYAPDTAANEEW